MKNQIFYKYKITIINRGSNYCQTNVVWLFSDMVTIGSEQENVINGENK